MAAFPRWAREALLPALAATPRLVAAHVLVRDPAATRGIGGQAGDGVPVGSPPWLVLAECGDLERAVAVTRTVLAGPALAEGGALPRVVHDAYRRQISVDASADDGTRGGGRRSPCEPQRSRPCGDASR